MSKLAKIIENPAIVFRTLGHWGLLNWLDDKIYLSILYRIIHGKKLNWNSPRTYNEKLQWLKIHNRDPLYSTLVDKYEVKKYIKDVIGEEYIIPSIGVWDSYKEINFRDLPDKFVLKCTHGSGGNIICKDKNKFDYKRAERLLNGWMKHNFYCGQREWPYKDVKPRIIAEQYIKDEQDGELRDYKFFVFNGDVKAMFIATERSNEERETCFDFFDENFKHLDIINGHPNAEILPHKPYYFELMKQLAVKLAKDIPHVRVDFYEADGKVYFGEMTFFHWSGFTKFQPEIWDMRFGDWLKLPENCIIRDNN